MREQIVITLAKPLTTHDGVLKRIVIREPSFDEYMDIGDPYTVAGTDGGNGFMVENPEVIKSYLTLCLVEPKDPALLGQAGARVARELKSKLLSFFHPVAEAAAASATSATNSPLEASASGQAKSEN